MSTNPPRSSTPLFRPRFTLGLVYFALFFFFYCGFIVLPALIEIAWEVSFGPELQELAEYVAREQLRGKTSYVALAALLTLGLGSYARILPGLR